MYPKLLPRLKQSASIRRLHVVSFPWAPGRFNSPVSRIGVRLQDLTTGELHGAQSTRPGPPNQPSGEPHLELELRRWDAIYDLGKAASQFRDGIIMEPLGTLARILHCS